LISIAEESVVDMFATLEVRVRLILASPKNPPPSRPSAPGELPLDGELDAINRPYDDRKKGATRSSATVKERIHK